VRRPSLLLFGYLFIGFLCPCGRLRAQDQPDLTLSEKTKSETISQIIELLKSKYVFPQVAAQMGTAIRDHAANHDYDPITSAQTFAEKLQSELRAVSKDQHLAVDYSYQSIPQQGADAEEKIDQEHADRIRYRGHLVNYWFKNADILPGNIGYLKFDGFFHLEFGGQETVEAAMTFLGGTNALIIDLRENRGGAPDVGSLIMGYLFDKRTHLSDFVSRPENSRTATWISPHQVGKKYEGDVYILTSKETISAAEGFAYDLQSVKRAVIVGEPTAGAAHPTFEYRVGEHFTLEVPTSRVINLATNTDWEGTGVKPDVVTDQALNRAQLLALRKLVKDQPDFPFLDERKKAIKQLEVELSGHP
jgi:retinol-binding protein 3